MSNTNMLTADKQTRELMVSPEQIHALYDANEIDHATWANALMHPDANLGVFARLRCAEILNARTVK